MTQCVHGTVLEGCAALQIQDFHVSLHWYCWMGQQCRNAQTWYCTGLQELRYIAMLHHFCIPIL